MRACKYCGKENDDEAGFCVGCGDSLDNPSSNFPPVTDEQKNNRVIYALIGLVAGIIGTGLTILISCEFFFVPHGSGIRPMGWVMAMILIVGASLVIGLPCSTLGTTSKKKLIGWMGIILAIAPGPLGFFMLRLAMAIHHLVLEP